MSPITKKIVTLLGILITLVGVYYVVILLSDTEVVMLDTSSDLAEQSEKLFADIQRVSAIEFNEGLFTDRRFTSLKDMRVELIDIPTGRSNPFAPIQ